jgi:hypothetical protein
VLTVNGLTKLIKRLDDPYSLEQLKDPRMNASVIRPLVDQYYKLQDVSVVYCLCVNRLQFLKEQANAPHHQSVNITRAILCELVANRILRRFSEDNPGAAGLLLLANILVAGFDPFQGAPEDVIKENDPALHWAMQKTGGYLRKLPTLEIAIISESKTFLSSSACQRVVNAIYEGRIIYTPSSFIDILPDHYKSKPISLYDPRKAPLLNQYRLIVPRTRNFLEIGQFIVLLVLYILVMTGRDPQTFSIVEFVFCIYTAGWVLDQFASILEHGWSVYTQNLWSFLDVTFALIYGIYFVIRMHGIRVHSFEVGQQAMDVLAIGAPFLIPRLAFNLMSENMLFVSLRSMMADFALLTALAVWCFAGFLLSMMWLGDGLHKPVTISKWMLWIWFGLDGTGIPRSVDFHWLLGPILMVTFAFLGNTLFLTILVSMLSNTFAGIVSNASAEIQYRRAVLTLEGVKSDAIFAYQPPFNIAALVFLLPLQFLVSPRWFHKVNVAAVRFLNAPLLLIIGYVERRALWAGSRRNVFQRRRARGMFGLGDISRGFSLHGDIQAVFDSAPTATTQDEINDTDDLEQEEQIDEASGPDRPMLTRTNTAMSTMSRPKSRRDSMAPFGGLKEQLRDLLHDAAESDSENSTDTGTRLDRLEESIKRIEGLVGRLVQNLIVEEDDGKLAPLEDNDQNLREEAHQ